MFIKCEMRFSRIYKFIFNEISRKMFQCPLFLHMSRILRLFQRINDILQGTDDETRDF